MRKLWIRRVAAILIPALLSISVGYNPRQPVRAAFAAEAQAPAVEFGWREWAVLHQAISDLTDEVLDLNRIAGDPGGLLGLRESMLNHRSSVVAALADVRTDLNRVEAELTAEGAPASVLGRHRNVRQTLDQRVQLVVSELDGVLAANGTEATVAQLQKLAEVLQAGDAPTVPTPSILPFGPPGSVGAVTQLPASLGLPPAIGVPISSGEPGEAELWTGEAQSTNGSEHEDEWSEIPPVVDPVANLALEIGDSAAAIAGWVYGNIQHQWYLGHAKEPAVTLQDGAGNDTDIAVLLATLLRMAGYPARYGSGTVALEPGEWTALTGLADGAHAARFFAAAGLPTSVHTTGEGTVTRVVIPHTWVEVWDAGQWRAVDAAWKGLGSTKAGAAPWVPRFDLHQYLIRNGGESPLEMWESQMRQAALLAGHSISDLSEPQADWTGELPGMPYTVVGDARSQASAPAIGVAKVSFQLPGLSLELPFTAVSGHRVTLSYTSFDEVDAGAVDAFGSMEQTPAYLLRLKPIVKVDGQTVAEGTVGILPGTIQALNISLRLGQLDETMVRPVYAGSWYTLLVTPHAVGKEGAERHESAALARPATSFDDLIGDQLLGATYKYVGSVDDAADRTARLMDLAVAHGPRVAVAGFAWRAYGVLGVPYAHGLGGRSFDAARVMGTAVDPQGRDSRAVDYWQVVGAEAGFRESHAFTPVTPAATPVTTLGQLSETVSSGERLHWVCRADGDLTLPDLAVSTRTQEQLYGAFQEDKLVITPTSGHGGMEVFILVDPATGASGYFLSDGTNGAWDSVKGWVGGGVDWVKDKATKTKEAVVTAVDDMLNLKWWEPLAWAIQQDWLRTAAAQAGLTDEQRHAVAGGLAVGLIDGVWAGLKGEWESIRDLPQSAQRAAAAVRWVDRFKTDSSFRQSVLIEMAMFLPAVVDLWVHRDAVVAGVLEIYGEHIVTRSGWSRNHPDFPYWAMAYAPGFVTGLVAEIVGVAYLTKSASAMLKATAVARLPKLLRFFSQTRNVALLRFALRSVDEVPDVLSKMVRNPALNRSLNKLHLANLDDLHTGQLSWMLHDIVEALKVTPVDSDVYRAARRAWQARGFTDTEAEILRLLQPGLVDPELRPVMRAIREAIDDADPWAPVEPMRKYLLQGQVDGMVSGRRDLIGGFVARRKHVSGARTPDEVIALTRQDYIGGAPETGNKAVYWVDFEFKGDRRGIIDTPFATELDGTSPADLSGYPFTGTGFTATKNGRWVPEYRYNRNQGHKVDIGTVIMGMKEDGTTFRYKIWNGDDWVNP